MRTMWRVLPALALLAVAAGPASAQKDKGFPVGGPGGGGGLLRLLEVPDVQKDLKLSDEQLKKINDLLQKQKQKFKELLKDVKGKEVFEKMKELTEAGQKAAMEMLTEPQKTRLKQLEFQTRGARAFVDPQVVKDLELTDEQVGKIRTYM